MIHRRHSALKDHPINKPWGHDINPDLWYVIVVEHDGVALVSGCIPETPNSRRHEYVLCFGNEYTAINHVYQDEQLQKHKAQVMKGSNILELFALAHIMEAQAAGNA